MPTVSPLEFLLFLVSLLLEAALVGMVVAWGWALLRIARGFSLIPEGAILPLPTASWGIGTVLLVILLHVGAGTAAGVACREFLGIDLGALVAEDKPSGSVAHGEAGSELEHAKTPRSASSARQLAIFTAIYNVLFLLTFPWIFRRVSGSGAKELGLSLHRWSDQLRLGVLAGLVAAPLVYAIQFLALTVFEVNAHPIEQMLQDGFSPGLALLALTSTVVLAPLSEEILFRGVLQGWLTRAWWTLTSTTPRVVSPEDANATAPQDLVGPPILAVPLKPGSPPRQIATNPICWPAVAMTSLLFAALHGPQWPAPIALFVFSMIMGAIYQRSGSLLASIAIHGLFNGCSTLLLLTQQLTRSLQKDEVAAETAVLGLAATWEALVRLLS